MECVYYLAAQLFGLKERLTCYSTMKGSLMQKNLLKNLFFKRPRTSFSDIKQTPVMPNECARTGNVIAEDITSTPVPANTPAFNASLPAVYPLSEDASTLSLYEIDKLNEALPVMDSPDSDFPKENSPREASPDKIVSCDTTPDELKEYSTVPMTFKATSWTNQGPRPRNEDYACYDKLSDGRTCAIISDGIGGGPHGDLYSKIACNHTAKILKSDSFNGEIKEVIEATQNYCLEIIDEAEDNGGGATLLVALFSSDGTVDCAFLGDSRLAVIDSCGNFTWVTIPDRQGGHALASAIGKRGSKINEASIRIESGSVAFLMTDGAWEYLEENEDELDQLKKRAASGEKAFDLAFWLSDTAGKEGSDNATVVAVAADVAEGKSCSD